MMLKDFHDIQTNITPTNDAETVLVAVKNIPGKYDMALYFCFYIVSMI